MIVCSLQSGTSADGIDVAVVDIAPVEQPRNGGSDAESADLSMRVLDTDTVPWSPELRERILRAAEGRPFTAGEFCRLDTDLGQAFAEVAASSVDAVASMPDLVVSHGQTLFHWVDGGRARGTLQLGEPAWIAERIGVPVLSHLRAADIAAGGEGAPLMAVFDRAWLGAEAAATGRALATVNIGGIANVQVVHPDGEVTAFDSGPGNGLVDAVVARHTDGRMAFDDGGRLAASGRVDGGLLDELLRHPYLAASPPKSTGRETFDVGVVDRAVAASRTEAIAFEDLVATLTEFTARTIAEALPADDDAPRSLVCSGGGALNPELLARLRAHAADRGIAVESSARRGIDPLFKESLMFALLGFLSWHGVPARLSSGGPGEPRVAGRFTSGRMPLQLPPPLVGVASVTVEGTDRTVGTERGGPPQ
ncbi:anhydro-N-acetylmuramic acid kinase [Agromyces sp. Marseille-P2726]|uniref:anhydro-N-acetylmuramic acid kinase n=1 Tax=Agromyces sp. Marseille-P2726 TaxID=2709132 RepID=UPI001570C7AE|nr:anhydro-N-acetylmuramic acid kinase [Agromyces sp. Marseille-P2726]